MAKIKLYGFNNLTKILSFNMYILRYAFNPEDKQHFIDFVNEHYSAKRLTRIMSDVTDIIGAHILNIAKQDYEPQGASANILIAEDEMDQNIIDSSCNRGELNSAPHYILGHLDKSHISIHTYPETHPNTDIMSLRADINVTTCGNISPLKALNFLIKTFSSDVIFCDYHIRGFTRDVNGNLQFRDHEINSIQDFVSAENLSGYRCTDVNLPDENIFHTKMVIKDLDMNDYLLHNKTDTLEHDKKVVILDKLSREMQSIAYGTGS